MIVLGIDPGIAIVGYGLIDYDGNTFRTISYGAITTPAHASLSTRLKTIYDDLTSIITSYKIDCVAIEELFFNKNVKTALDVAQARGVIVVACMNNNIPLYEYTPLQVKQGVVGYGRAVKSQIQEMVKIMLNLPKVPKPDDVADGLAIAICHCNVGEKKEIFKA
ncbi:crossover junction endodeoxyribonuclease RuvC [Criibacterium bergeronii]|uniref:Crossover junction endodeoxyribonuclease RuvC n=1 Tax=Criibacterium bergeronii TaxID=1871336 RepID=A0A371IJ01_9FIRM|nr:crossover junction endodeoxyribonuclease RuvC [Criibacterium bergeronii]RDY20443.1 crossover junction endodeoxyribonuclease RuvC [Criibacterium bergeronii]